MRASPYLSEYVCQIWLRSDGRVEREGGGGYRQTDKGTLQLYIVDVNLFIFLLFSKDDRSRYLSICDTLLS